MFECWHALGTPMSSQCGTDQIHFDLQLTAILHDNYKYMSLIGIKLCDYSTLEPP